MKAWYLFLLYLLCSPEAIFAQNNKPMQVELAARYTPGAVTLRWAPADFKTWDWGVHHGYALSRSTIKLNGQPVSLADALVTTILAAERKPLNAAQFQQFVNANNDRDWPLLAAGTLYGEGFKSLNADTANIYDVVALRDEQQNRLMYSLMAAEQDFPTALAMGWAFVDSSIQANAEYRYEIRLIDATNAQAKKGTAIVQTMNPVSLPQPQLSLTPGDRVVTLRWERDNLDRHYVSYAAERSADNGASWQPANSKPIVFVSTDEAAVDAYYWKDSLAQNGQQYQYRLRGMSSFGVYGPYSATASATGAPGPVPGVQISLIATLTVENKITLNWTLPQSVASRIAYLRVLRAPDQGKNYVQISGNLPVSQTWYNDLNPGAANYYVVEAVDENGHPHRSIAVLGQPNDNEKPLPPAAPLCSCDKKGRVLIHWAPSASNDVMGYRVYQSNVNKPAEMQQITADWTADTFYRTDVSMNTLSEDLFFSVRALDHRENYSDFSLPCTAKRPDVVPPAPPVIAKYTLVGEDIEFNFTPSSSTDVVIYKLMRRVKNYVDWDKIVELKPEELTKPWTDTSANIMRTYEYRLVAVDEVPLEGASNILEVKPFDNKLRGPILNLVSSFPGSPPMPPKAVGLGWNYAGYNNPDLMGFQIMRGVAGDPLRNLLFLTSAQSLTADAGLPSPLPGQFAFVDYDVSAFRKLILQGQVGPFVQNPQVIPGPTGVGVQYAVYAKFTDGAMSEIAKIVVSW